MIVEAIHVISFSFFLSRIFAPENAWKNNLVDFISGVLACVTWVIIAIDTQQGSSEITQSLVEYQLLFVLVFLLIFLFYIFLTYVFIEFRAFLGE